MSEVPRLLLSCGSLQHSERVELLAAFIRKHRVTEGRSKFKPLSDPGVCQLCGHALPHAYRAFDLSQDPVSSYEIPTGSADAAQVQVWRRERERRHDEPIRAQPDSLSFVALHACPEMENEALWDEAVARLRQNMP